MFLSKYTNSVDKKGRVCVPSSYRNVVSKEKKFIGIIMYPSVRNECIEACTLGRMEVVYHAIQELDYYSEERDAFEAIIFGESVQLNFDNEGRVIVPEYLIQHGKITSQMTFVGKGDVFEMWNPELYVSYLINSRKIAANNKTLLKTIKINNKNLN